MPNPTEDGKNGQALGWDFGGDVLRALLYTRAMYAASPLSSGLTVLTAPTDGTASITAMVFVGAGSRYEEQSERGISHFLEHMFFKGGKRYPTTRDVSGAIDSVGGSFNAFTGKEYAGYYVKVAAEQVELACDVLGDMLLQPAFPTEDIEKERGVIIEEERMYQDTPMYRVGWDFEQLLYGDHPLGWDTIGTEEVIRSVTREDFLQHKKRFYTPDNAVVVFAGKVTEEQAGTLAQRFFGSLAGKKQRVFSPLERFGEERVFLRTKKTEQAHLVLGVPGVSALDDAYFAQRILGVILGGNMSSRMFLNIRDARGLCYYISTEVDNYLDAGALSTRAGVDQTRLFEAITAIREEYVHCAEGGVTEEEVAKTKAYLKGGITLSLEDSEERAHFFGRQQLLYPKVRDIDEFFAAIDAVTKEDVDALAKEILTPEALRLVVIGQEKDEAKLRALL